MTQNELISIIVNGILFLVLAWRELQKKLKDSSDDARHTGQLEAKAQGQTQPQVQVNVPNVRHPATFDELKGIIDEVELLRGEVAKGAGRIKDLEERLDLRDKRVELLEGHVDRLTKDVERRDEIIKGLRQGPVVG